MPYKITMRPGHPKGQFRRDGRLFTEDAPVFVDELSEALAKELDRKGTFLRCEEVQATEAVSEEAEVEEAVEVPANFKELKVEQLRDLAQGLGIDISGKPKKADLIAWIEHHQERAQ